MDTMGLVPTLRRHIINFAGDTGISVRVVMPNKIKISSPQNICLFRVAQEALMNIYKHAKTNSAAVTLKSAKGKAILIVTDHGKGFDIPQGYFSIHDR
jgi:two-component system NarL family sensor kinase